MTISSVAGDVTKGKNQKADSGQQLGGAVSGKPSQWQVLLHRQQPGRYQPYVDFQLRGGFQFVPKRANGVPFPRPEEPALISLEHAIGTQTDQIILRVDTSH